MANVPDANWKTGWLAIHEGPTHYFKWNEYKRSTLRDLMPIPLAKSVDLVGRQYIVENGSAVWRTQQIFDLFQTAVNENNWPSALKMGGVLGHYIGDLSQPMHVSTNYDGQSIKKPGIHAKFETKLVNSLNREELLTQVLSKAKEKVSLFRSSEVGDTVKVSFDQGKRSLKQLPKLLKEYERDEIRNEILVPQLIEALSDGAATLTMIWDKVITTEGTADFPSERLVVHAPKWVSFKLSNTTTLMPIDACVHNDEAEINRFR